MTRQLPDLTKLTDKELEALFDAEVEVAEGSGDWTAVQAVEAEMQRR